MSPRSKPLTSGPPSIAVALEPAPTSHAAPSLVQAPLSPKEPKGSSADLIVSSVLRDLYDGRVKPGQKLTEAELTGRLGVGRGSVREALRRLEVEGLVTVSLHRGATVRHLSRSDVSDVLGVIEALTSLSARLAAQRLSSNEDRQALQDALARMEAVTEAGDSFDLGRASGRFYREMTRVSGNRELIRMVPMLQAHIIRIQFSQAYSKMRDERRLADYEQILTAILANDGPAAERAARRHVRNIATSIHVLPDEAFAR